MTRAPALAVSERERAAISEARGQFLRWPLKLELPRPTRGISLTLHEGGSISLTDRTLGRHQSRLELPSTRVQIFENRALMPLMGAMLAAIPLGGLLVELGSSLTASVIACAILLISSAGITVAIHNLPTVTRITPREIVITANLWNRARPTRIGRETITRVFLQRYVVVDEHNRLISEDANVQSVLVKSMDTVHVIAHNQPSDFASWLADLLQQYSPAAQTIGAPIGSLDEDPAIRAAVAGHLDPEILPPDLRSY